MRRQPRLRSVVGVCLLLAGCAGMGWLTGADAPHWHAEPMPAWEKAFRNADARWGGADGACSVPLSDSETLWLFGDTWIARPGAKGREGGRIIRNSLALQAIGAGLPGKIDFFWKRDNQGPKAPFRLIDGPGWLWPMSGERVGDSLYLFFGQFVPNDSKLGFETAGCWLFRISNPDDPPAEWEAQRFRVPFFEHTRNGDLTFGVACMAYKGYLYVYGVKEDWSRGMEGRSLLVARVPLAEPAVPDFSLWRFFAGDGWAPEVGRSASLFDGAATEMSVSFLQGRDRFLAVYSHCGLSAKVLGRLARNPEGPWGRPVTLYRCPEVTWKKDYFCYAGKAHPELAQGDNETVITYAVNSWNEDDHERDLRIYWPRFVRVVAGMD